MTADQLWSLGLSFVSAILITWIGWVRKDTKDADAAKDARIMRLEGQIQDIHVKMAGDLPKKEDLKEIQQDIEAIRAMVAELRDMVIRIQAREGR